jgi:hypothetical protein
MRYCIIRIIDESREHAQHPTPIFMGKDKSANSAPGYAGCIKYQTIAAFIREEDAVDAAAVAELPRVTLALPLFLRAIVYYSNRNYSVEFDV